MAWYQDWFSSPFYHQLYFEQEQEASRLIPNLLACLKPAPGSRLLDAACGRGQTSIRLADAGFDVNGVDGSMDTIRYAQQFQRDQLSFAMHDLRLPFWVNYFDLAFHLAPFGYYATRREHDDAIHTLAAGLKTGGYLVMNNRNAHYEEDHLVPHEIKQVEETSFEINRWQDDQYFFKRIRITGPRINEPLEYTEQWMKLSFGDINDMLSFQKMQVTNVYGNNELHPYHVRQSPAMVVIAKKMG